MQLGVFGFCGYEDGDIGVGVFPECEEIVVGGTSLRCVALKGIGAGKTEVREGSRFHKALQPLDGREFFETRQQQRRPGSPPEMPVLGDGLANE
jgi:hypothetical protein